MRFDREINGLFAQAEDERHHRELTVMHAIINDPASGVEAARELGAGAHLFGRQDMLVMWVACQGAGVHGRETVERMVVELLRDEGLLAAGGKGVNGVWSRDVLARFVRHFSPFPCPDVQRSTLALLVPKLIDIYTAHRDAGEYIRHACTLLERGAA